MGTPTREDAQLLMQLVQWGTALGIEDATLRVLSDDFDPETVDPHDAAVRKMLEFGETIGTLVKNDLLSFELVNDWLWVEGIWSRVGPAALRERAKYGEARLFENFEALARGA
jgi:hypothetical protein